MPSFLDPGQTRAMRACPQGSHAAEITSFKADAFQGTVQDCMFKAGSRSKSRKLQKERPRTMDDAAPKPIRPIRLSACKGTSAISCSSPCLQNSDSEP